MGAVIRELPDGARQQTGRVVYPLRAAHRTFSRLRRERPIPRIRVPGNRNKSGTAEVIYAFVS